MYSDLGDFQKEFEVSKNAKVNGYEGYSLSAYENNKKVLNFSPGPTTIPEKVMKDLIKEINDDWILGITPMEISHIYPE